MRRFKITNNKTGLEFRIEGDELGEMQPEWGEPQDRTIIELDLTDEIENQKRKKNEEELNDGIRKAARKRLIDADLSKIKDADLRMFLSDLRVFLSKWQ